MLTIKEEAIDILSTWNRVHKSACLSASQQRRTTHLATMKLLFLLSALLVSLLLAAKVSADFMIYRYDHDGRTLKDYNMLFTSNPAHFHAPPSCSELETAELFFVQWRADVVGRRGFVLEGDNASPRRLEWNMPKEGHHFSESFSRLVLCYSRFL